MLVVDVYNKIENIWFRFPEKLRFLLVGGFNTVFAYAIFAALYELAGLNYNLALIIQYFITVNFSFVTMRYYVFQSQGILKYEYIKAISVYVGIYFFNAFVLNVLVQILDLYPLFGQALYLIISTILTFILHKYFSFRVKKA